ncbi:MAG: hypothetical protein U0V74_16285 [Chitinophagales bacterium]
MKKSDFGISIVFLLILVPFIGIYFMYGKADPFTLKGPQFLTFYGLLSMVLIFLYWFFCRRSHDFFRYVSAAILFIVGAGRLWQGLQHNKPIGYLSALILADVIIIAVITTISANYNMGTRQQ